MCPGGQEGQQDPGLDQEWCGQQEQGGDRAPVLGTGEAAPRVLCSVLGPSLQEGSICFKDRGCSGEGDRHSVAHSSAQQAALPCSSHPGNHLAREKLPELPHYLISRVKSDQI